MSDFAAARLHLERAYDYLHGNDETSRRAREALDLLIEAVAASQYRRPWGQVVAFREEAGVLQEGGLKFREAPRPLDGDASQEMSQRRS